jgi:hypothetical protein
MYLYVKSTSQGSEWSCICMLGVQARGVSDPLAYKYMTTHSLACTPNLQIHDHSLSWLVLLTYKYMATHSPGLYS